MFDFLPFPNINGETNEKKIAQLSTYLIQLKEAIEFAMRGMSDENKSVADSLAKALGMSNEVREDEVAQLGNKVIKADKISLEGTVTANENFKVLTDGSIESKNGKFSGTINGSEIISERTVTKYAKDYTQADLDRAQAINLRRIEPNEMDYEKYDLDGNGEINTKDCLIIHKFLLGELNEYTFTNYIKISSGYDYALLKTNGVLITRGGVISKNINADSVTLGEVNTTNPIDDEDTNLYRGATTTITLDGCKLTIVNGLIVGMDFDL